VSLKRFTVLNRLLRLFSDNGQSTIAELSSQVNLSIPKVTAMVNELIDMNLAADFGKESSSGGRPPNVYGLNASAVHFVGVDVRAHDINIGIANFNQDIVEFKDRIPFRLKNQADSLEELCNLISGFIESSSIDCATIEGIGINLSGRINQRTGYSYSFFNFQERPLSEVLSEKLGYDVYLENDSRAMAYAEYKNLDNPAIKNVLFLNLDYGIGMGVVINGELYYGKSGYSGEVGHIPIFENNVICQCGKQGCLETEASGWALVNEFKKSIESGANSVIVKDPSNIDCVNMNDIIKAAMDDDVLAIELISRIGEKIGRGLAVVINIFNPELVILGGSLSKTGDYIRLPIKSAVNKLSLSLMNNDTQIEMASLGSLSGVKGASLLVRKKMLRMV